MIKQTLFFSTPVCLSLRDCQLVVSWKDSDDKVTRPIEDLGCVVLENQMISITYCVQPLHGHCWVQGYCPVLASSTRADTMPSLLQMTLWSHIGHTLMKLWLSYQRMERKN